MGGQRHPSSALFRTDCSSIQRLEETRALSRCFSDWRKKQTKLGVGCSRSQGMPSLTLSRPVPGKTVYTRQEEEIRRRVKQSYLTCGRFVAGPVHPISRAKLPNSGDFSRFRREQWRVAISSGIFSQAVDLHRCKAAWPDEASFRGSFTSRK